MSDSPTLFADEQDLLDELRAMAPRPSAEFAATLDGRVAERFGEPERPAAAPRRRRFSWPRMPQLLAGSLASAFVAVIVVVAIVSRGEDRSDRGASTASAVSTTSAEIAAPQRDATAAAGSANVPLSEGTSSGSAPRRVERQAQLTVSIARGDFDEAAARVPQIAAAANAIVDTSQVATDSGGGHATYRLRVPVGRLGDTLAQLSKLGRVTARNETGYDITGAVVSAEDRLGDLRAERDSVRRRLAQETDDDRAAQLRDELAALRRQVARVRGEAVRLQQRTSYAVVSLTLDERRADGSESGSDSDQGGIAGALDDAGDILKGMAAAGIVAAAVAIPVAVLLALLWKAASVLRRRRREAGLA